MEFFAVLVIAFVAIKLGENYGKPVGYKRAKMLLEAKELSEEE